MRHLGRHKTSGEQVAVIWMLLPNQTANALVTYIDRVRDPLRRELMVALGTPEAQQALSLSDAISRRQYADTQTSILNVLHEQKQLHPVTIDDIMMTPDGHHQVPLRTVLEAIGQLGPQQAPVDAPKFNPHTYNTAAEGSEELIGQARNLIIEAELMEGDARAKRARAYAIAPSLNPNVPAPAPAVVEAVVEAPAATDPATSAE